MSLPPKESPRPITVVLARFDDLRARGLRQLIAEDSGLEILAEDIEQHRISAVLRGHRPVVAILAGDRFAKLADVRELSVAHPSTRLVLLADRLSSVENAQLLAFGASACLRWDTQGRDVLNAIHLAARGLQLTPRSAGQPHEESLSGGHLLTRREAEVLPLLRQGSSNSQIALVLQIGLETVRTHVRNIYRKLGVASRGELTTTPVGERSVEPVARERRAPRQAGARGESRRRAGSEARAGDVGHDDS